MEDSDPTSGSRVSAKGVTAVRFCVEVSVICVKTQCCDTAVEEAVFSSQKRRANASWRVAGVVS